MAPEPGSSTIPPDVQQLVAQAVASGRWLILAVHVNDGSVRLERTSHGFPRIDIDTAVRLIVDDAEQMKGER